MSTICPVIGQSVFFVCTLSPMFTGITPEICCLRFRFASLRQGKEMLPVPRQRFVIACLRGVVYS